MVHTNFFKTAVAASLLMTASATAFPQSVGRPDGPAGPSSTIIIHKKPLPPPDDPKKPGHPYIEISYVSTHRSLVFNLRETAIQSLSVEIENQMSGEIHYGSVDVSYPVMDVCLEPASYSITCTAEDGSLYAGEFEIY